MTDTVHTIRMVDLGFAMARIKRQQFANGIHTTLVLTTPALTENGQHQPAQSAEAYMNEAQAAVLVKALTDPLTDEERS